MIFLPYLRRYLFFCCLALLLPGPGLAQSGIKILTGQNYSLSVVPVPGETYEWAIYSDYTLQVPATPAEVRWLSPNTGPEVLLEWKESGIFYFTVIAISQGGCMNLKVGQVSVNQTAHVVPGITIRPDRNPICKGSLVVFNSSVVHQGGLPRYTWRKNGEIVGYNSPRYADRNLNEGDLITCQLTSSNPHANPINVLSNRVQISVFNTSAAFSVEESVSRQNWELQMINRSVNTDRYEWDFGNGQTSVEENPVVKYYTDGTYRIKLISTNSEFNCADTATYIYQLMFKGLYIPNAFAPTTDVPVANTFKPAGSNLKEYRIEVYDSWGHLLWESDKLSESGNPVEAWDGTYKGELLPQGTYMWKVSAVFRDGTVWTGSDIGHGKGSTMGTVTLIR
jgi:gliding motility-associated-like protein